ncbi:MAG: helix-hairpin-helix domain-containing protein [Lentisphaerales bacterium]|nr:helix-hairpin-helix domain-containing protein [Lentisphaerales bacterium]
MSADQDQIKDLLTEANKTYRLTGDNSQLSDQEYDFLLDMVDDDSFRSKVGIEVEKNKIELSVPMGSLNKVKTLTEINSWCDSKKIPKNTQVCITPKFDGLSLLVEFENGIYKSAATRGDGVTGQNVTQHFRYTQVGQLKLPAGFTGFLVGETIMKEETFEKKHSKKFKNPRNMVAGLLSRKQISQELEDVDFIAFSVKLVDFPSTSEELTFCNKYVNRFFGYEVKVLTQFIKDLKDDWLQGVFDAEKAYQCDGLVIEINDSALQEDLGQETNSLNPAYARAWKPESDDTRTSKVRSVIWQVSKNGSQKPVVQIEPVDLGGVTISNVTGINAKFISENGIGPDSVVTIIRSGDVIPKIINVVVSSKDEVLPSTCSCCGSELKWNENEIDLMCHNPDCGEMKISENTEFFKIMGIDEVGEGIVKQLFQAGYTSVEQILSLDVQSLLALEGFKEKKAQKVHQSIHDCLQNVALQKLQHASNLFKGLGSRKLELLANFDSPENLATLEQIIAVEGYSEISARAYLAAINEFWIWQSKLPVSIAPYEKPAEGVLSGKTVVLTGFRSPEIEAAVQEEGGKIGSSVSGKTYALVMKKKGSGSSKEKKALSAGVLVLEREEFEEMLAKKSFS